MKGKQIELDKLNFTSWRIILYNNGVIEEEQGIIRKIGRGPIGLGVL
jgi:hypothetical protein